MVTCVTVVGAGRMGLWFYNYFSSKSNYIVSLYDKKKIKLYLKERPYKLNTCKSLGLCVRDADIVIICVPIGVTASLIKKCIPMMKKGACIVEISSLKSDIFNTLSRVPESLIPISIHPMFGPGAKVLHNSKILMIPIRNEKKEQRLVKSIFNEAKIRVIKDPKYHDKLMAMILGMVYYINLIFAMTLDNESIPLLKKFSGTTFYLQTLLLESILIDNSSLISSLLANNTELPQYLKKYNQESTKLINLITRNKVKLEREISRVRKNYSVKRNTTSYEKMYSIISRMNNT